MWVQNHTGVVFLACAPSPVFPRGFPLTFWSSLLCPTVSSHDNNNPNSFWETQTTPAVQNLTNSMWPNLFLILPHTPYTLSLEPSRLTLTCHIFSTGEHTPQAVLSDISGWSVGHTVSQVMSKLQSLQMVTGLARALFNLCCCSIDVSLYLRFMNYLPSLSATEKKLAVSL